LTSINIVQCPLTEVRKHLEAFGEIFVVCDKNVFGICQRLHLPARGICQIEATESNKIVDTVLGICRWLLEQGADRKAFVLGVGGGITTDISGFAASIYKRGVRFGFLPTTLLSQVDAAIGGKNGVNLDSYKNMLGIIRQPEMTFICPEVLETLSEKEITSGAAELLKTFIIRNDNGNYEKAVQTLSEWQKSSGSLSGLGSLVGAAAQVKADIAGRDPNEHGERRLLNLGHTFAHAIEKNSKEKIAHGHAVAMGIILAARLSEALGLAQNGFADSLEADFKSCGLPTECPFSVKELADAMRKDKKADGDIIHFVLPLAIGKVETRDLSVDAAIDALSHE
jgi:3-dehydroquinate synthase